VVDGQPHVAAAAGKVRQAWAERHGSPFTLLVSPQNEGKGGAVLRGLRYLTTTEKPEYCLVRDADGDHRVNDMPALVELAVQILEETSSSLVVVTGGRQSLARPMNWWRAQLEQWLHAYAIEGLQFSLAAAGQVLNTQYWAAYGDLPDLESGCKVYSQAAASLAVDSWERADAAYPELDLRRWGCELIPLAEVLLHGGTLGEVRRLTYESQPHSGYDGESGVTLYAHQMIWLARRLNLTALQAAQLLDNALVRLDLWSEAEGRRLAFRLRSSVLADLPGPLPPDEISLPRFC
jgi:hypothetical protein